MDERKAKTFTKRNLPAGVRTAVLAAEAKKGEAIIVIDLRGAASFTDFFVITNGLSSRQNAAIRDGVETALRAEGLRPLGVEGADHGEWILLDYGSFIVHVFSRPARAHYALEKLWGDAPKLVV
jgi:ribosome-associated protein